MKKILFTIAIQLFFGLILYHPSPIYADWAPSDNGIQKVNQDSVPQITTSGKIQNFYTADSFFPLALYFTDLGPVPDQNGQPQGQVWNNFRLNSTTSRNSLSEVKDAGFNTIWPSWFFPNQAEIALIQQYGIKVYPNVDGYIRNSINQNNWQILKDAVNTIKNNPAVLAWHLYDEGILGTTDQMKQAYDAIKSVDPVHAVFANTVGLQCAADNYSDFLNGDIYPISSGSTPTFQGIGGILSCPSGIKKPTFIILQAFSGDGPWIMPTPAQIRGQMYAAIVHGSTGLWLFLQHSPWAWMQTNAVPYNQQGGTMQGISPQVNSLHWQAASKANHEITDNKAVFLAKTATDNYHTFYQRNCTPTIPSYCMGCPNPSNCNQFNGDFYRCAGSVGCSYETSDNTCNGTTCTANCKQITDSNQCAQSSCSWVNDCNNHAVPQPPLHTMVKDTGETDVRYLLAVNVDNALLNTKFSFDNYPKNIARVTSVFDNRTITSDPSNAKGFIDNGLAGYDARLYKIEFGSVSSPPPTPTPTTTSVPTPTPTPPPAGGYLPGDINRSGKVDIFDYNLLVADFGKTGSPGFSPADLNNDGKVDIFDYNILVGNFGKTI